MLIHKERTESLDRRLACTLAAVAGALNAAAFHAVGFFSANMTGNVSIISDRIASGQIMIGLGFLAIVAAFIFGAAVSSLLINAGRRRATPGVYAYSILTEAVLLALLGAADLWLLDAARAPVLVIGLSFLMGLQNAVVTRISNARVRTTHISGMATDIGIELGMLADVALGREAPKESAPNMSKLRLHSETVLSFLLGGIVGVMIYASAGGILFLLTAILLLTLSVAGLARVR